jgi:hypothetical protein
MGEWLSLMEFATRNSVSISTLRRQIKGGKLQSRTEGGRYLLWHDGNQPAASKSDLLPRIAELELQLKKAREEIAELKTLLAFYEEQPLDSQLSI